MGFVDFHFVGGLVGKRVSGLGISQTAAMRLRVAAGSVTLSRTGEVLTLPAARSHVFSADASRPKRCLMAIVHNGTRTDLWVDEYVDDGRTERSDPPAGYTVKHVLAWFQIAASETDLLHGDVNRRIIVDPQ